MKIAAIIFTALGMMINFYYSVPLGFIGLVIGIAMIISLGSDKKFTALGILGLIFTGLLGGILYLCWTPEDK